MSQEQRIEATGLIETVHRYNKAFDSAAFLMSATLDSLRGRKVTESANHWRLPKVPISHTHTITLSNETLLGAGLQVADGGKCSAGDYSSARRSLRHMSAAVDELSMQTREGSCNQLLKERHDQTG